MDFIAPEVEVAVAQPQLLGRGGLTGDRERQNGRGRLHGECFGPQLHLSGGQTRIDRGAFAADDGAGHRHHALDAQRVGLGEGGRAGGKDNLRQAVMVSHVKEQQAAMVALAMHPARYPGGVAGVGRAQLVASMGAVGMHGAVSGR